MTKVLCLLVSTLLLSGCPAMFIKHIENKSNDVIYAVPTFETDKEWKAKPGDVLRDTWSWDCLSIKRGDKIFHYDLQSLPDDVYRVGVFSTSMKAEFRDESLYVKTKNGTIVTLEKVSECPTHNKKL